MAKTPLILCPGLLCDGLLWRHQTESLGDVADIIIADLTRDDSVAGMARRVLENAPERFALAGLSMGGYVAQEIMRQAPERVIRLALMDTTAQPDPPAQSARREGFINLAQMGKFMGVTPRLLPLLIHPDRLGDQALTQAVMDMARHVGKEAFVRQQTAIINRPDSRGDLARIACPTLVVCGRQDALTPLALHEEMAAAIPDARLVVIEECGHLPPMERPQAASALLRYWLQG